MYITDKTLESASPRRREELLTQQSYRGQFKFSAGRKTLTGSQRRARKRNTSAAALADWKKAVAANWHNHTN